MRIEVLEVLESHFGKNKDITAKSHLMDDLGGDEFDIVDVFVQIESKLGISIPEEETFDIMTVSALCEVVERHVGSD
jgi:acyl carrier protein